MALAAERPFVDLSIIIVAWNVGALLDSCLKSIHRSSVAVIGPTGRVPSVGTAGPTVEILVVDSASTDDTSQVLRSFPAVYGHSCEVNIGFTKASNLGISLARGRYFLLLNPDTELRADTLAVLVSFLDRHKDVGIVGPRTLNSNGTVQLTRRRFPTLTTALFVNSWAAAGLLCRRPPARVARYYYANDVSDDAIADVDWVQGSALMARRAVYETIGALDERFVMYYEEVDWCRRAKAFGWRVVYLGVAEVVHHRGRSTEQVPERRRAHYEESKIRYFEKHHGRLAAMIVRVLLWLGRLKRLDGHPSHRLLQVSGTGSVRAGPGNVSSTRTHY